MDEISSSEFRRRYATLTEPVFVTVNGHKIGQWVPYAASEWQSIPQTPGGPPWPQDTIQQRAGLGADEAIKGFDDAVRFNSQPFTGPIPKKGK